MLRGRGGGRGAGARGERALRAADKLSEDTIVGIGAALLDPARRDALIGWTAETTGPGVMRGAWLSMVQQLVGEARAYAAAVCALAALLEGDGATANVALDDDHL